jgi:hypothetical protein
MWHYNNKRIGIGSYQKLIAEKPFIAWCFSSTDSILFTRILLRRCLMELTAHEKYEFKRLIEDLKTKTGRGTELISLYIPPDKQISDVNAQLRDEHGQAANIKSKITRTNVQSA